jgi:hypothetical protein
MASSPSQVSPLAPPQPTPPLPPPPAANQALHYATSTALIGAPLLLLIPPRKLDLYTFSLCTLWAASAEHQVRARSGKGILQWAAHRSSSRKAVKQADSAISKEAESRRETVLDAGLSTPNGPSTTLRWQQRVDPWAARGARMGFDGRRSGDFQTANAPRRERGAENRARLENATELAAADAERSTALDPTSNDPGGVRGLARQVWMGNEPPDWKDRRMAEEQRAAQEGQSVGDRILQQIWAVWNQAHLEADDARRRKEALEGERRERGG